MLFNLNVNKIDEEIAADYFRKSVNEFDEHANEFICSHVPTCRCDSFWYE